MSHNHAPSWSILKFMDCQTVGLSKHELWCEWRERRTLKPRSQDVVLPPMYLHNHVCLALWNRCEWMYLLCSKVLSSNVDLTPGSTSLVVCSIPSWKCVFLLEICCLKVWQLANRTLTPGKLYLVEGWAPHVKNMSSSVGMIIPFPTVSGKISQSCSSHQPDTFSVYLMNQMVNH